MGFFGEALYAHIGEYETVVYGAIEQGEMLIPRQSLTKQDVNDIMISGAEIGQNDSENQTIMLSPKGANVSWSLRIAKQTERNMTTNFAHVAYWESTLSAYRNLDALVYFPFITRGEDCQQMVSNREKFNLSRWPMCMREVEGRKTSQNESFGKYALISKDMLKKVVCYILGKLEVNAKKYLYVLVPQSVPYQAYCEAIIWQILSVIPIGLRKGITIATNSTVKEEDNFGIIFQKEAVSTRHNCDISFHDNCQYEFLDDCYLSENMIHFIESVVENPEMVEKCYQDVELPTYGEELPGKMDPYESYYGISRLHVSNDETTYLELCEELLRKTQENQLQKNIVENAIQSKIKSEDCCREYIKKDREYVSITKPYELNEYLKKRRNLAGYLKTLKIDFEYLSLNDKLSEIYIVKRLVTDADKYQESVKLVRNLPDVSNEARKHYLDIMSANAWREFEKCIPENEEIENPNSGWTLERAFEQYERLYKVEKKAPSEITGWYNTKQLNKAVKALYDTVDNAVEFAGIDTNRLDILIDNVLDIAKRYCLQYSKGVDKVFEWAQSQYERYGSELSVDASTARMIVERLIVIHRRCRNIDKDRLNAEYKKRYEQALIMLMDIYLKNCSNPREYAYAIDVCKKEVKDNYYQYIDKLNFSAMTQIQNESVPDDTKEQIYQEAVKGLGSPIGELKEAYELWKSTKKQGEISEAGDSSNLIGKSSQAEINEVCEKPGRQEESHYDNDEINKLFSTAKTYVKYLKAVINYESDDEKRRDELQRQYLERCRYEERDFASFLSAVFYIKKEDIIKEGLVGYILSDESDAKKIREELQNLVENQRIGLLLRGGETLQEIYQKVEIYKKCVGDTGKLILYSISDDKAGLEISRNLIVSNLSNVLICLIKIQNDYLQDIEDNNESLGEEENPYAQMNKFLVKKENSYVLQFMEKIGVFRDKNDLIEGFRKIGLPHDLYQSESKQVFWDIQDSVPYIAFCVPVLLIFALIFFLSHGTGTRVTNIGSDMGMSVTSSNEDYFSDASKGEFEEIDKNDETNSVDNSDSKDGKQSEGSDTSNSENTRDESKEESGKSENTSDNSQYLDGEQDGQNTYSFKDGKFTSNRPMGVNKHAIKNDDGYDVDGDGSTDLYPVKKGGDDELLIGFSFRTDRENAQILAVRGGDYTTVGYDINGDNEMDSNRIVDENGDSIGFDLDEDGMCDIGHDFE